jgi:acetyl esterase/lipase
MSLRAEILRFALRRMFKRRNRDTADIAAVRRQVEAFKWFVPNPPADTTVTKVIAGNVRAIRVATPRSDQERHMLYLHGGGYVYGGPTYYRDLLWRIADVTRSRVLCIEYRLAPEHPFPAALDDAVAAYRWLLAEGVDPRRLAIMGDSAGGGLTFAALLRLRDENTALPAAAVTLSPWTDLTMSGESVRRFARADPMLSPEQADTYRRWYLADADPRHPHASPLFGDPTGLPPTLIQVGSDEILLDDSRRMADRMRNAGCRVSLEVWPRMPHVWHLYARVLPEAQRAIERIGAFVDAHLPLPAAQACVARASA